MKKEKHLVFLLAAGFFCSVHLHAQGSPLEKIIGAFSKTIKDNPQDTSSADLTMKVLGNIMGGNGVSAADSAAAIQKFMGARGGNGVHYQYSTTVSSQKKTASSDTSNMYFTENGEGRSEMNLPAMMGVKGRATMVVIAHSDQRQYSCTLDAAQKTYSLNVLDSSLINAAEGKYQVTKVGNENIQGYNCMHAKVVSAVGSGMFASSATSDIWMSTGVPGYSFIKTAMLQSVTPTMLQALDKAGCGGFFVKLVTAGKDYSMTMLLVSAVQQNFPASLFRIPQGYTESKQNMLIHMMSPGK